MALFSSTVHESTLPETASLPLKIDGWIQCNFLLGWPYLKGPHVNFREASPPTTG